VGGGGTSYAPKYTPPPEVDCNRTALPNQTSHP
jgi:hypothetical protein